MPGRSGYLFTAALVIGLAVLIVVERSGGSDAEKHARDLQAHVAEAAERDATWNAQWEEASSGELPVTKAEIRRLQKQVRKHEPRPSEDPVAAPPPEPEPQRTSTPRRKKRKNPADPRGALSQSELAAVDRDVLNLAKYCLAISERDWKRARALSRESRFGLDIITALRKDPDTYYDFPSGGPAQTMRQVATGGVRAASCMPAVPRQIADAISSLPPT